jgi:hypothetical protein
VAGAYEMLAADYDWTFGDDHEIGFRPFTVSELRERLELAGLREVGTDLDAARDRYAMVTVPA